jgi:glucokinase
MLLGFDIGGTKCAVLMAETRGERIEIVQKEVMPTDRPVYEMIEALFVAAERMLGSQRLARLEGIGISCGGPLSSKRGMILSPPNLPGWDNVPMVKMTEERFGKKTLLQNDANACAMAEWKFGAGMGYNNVIFLTFGTGMGAGLILDGRLYSGTTDLAGEIGHLRLSEMGPVGFGKAGSFEGWASGGGIAQLAQSMVRQKLQMGEKVSFCSGFTELYQLTARTVAEAAFAGDELAKEIYRVCGYWLGRGIALLVDVLNPEIIILGSIFGRVRPLIEPSMRAVIDAESLADSNADCRIVEAGLGENIGDMAALTLADFISKEKTTA